MHVRALSLRTLGLAGLTGVLACLTACGGNGSSNTPGATSGLSYVNPTTTGYRLVLDAASTPSHLLLDLVGPSGAQIQGGTLNLNVDTTKATWANPGGSDPYLLPGTALSLGTGTPLLKSKLAGPVLEAGLFQKGAASPATLGQQAIFTVALNQVAGAKGAVSLSATGGQILEGSGATQSVVVAVGTLSAK